MGFSCRAVPEAAFVEFWPEYRFEKKRIREHRQAIEARVTRLLRPLRSLPPVEQERAIHDFIVETSAMTSSKSRIRTRSSAR